MSGYFIEFERGDQVRVKGESLKYTVMSVDFRGAPKYDPNIADAVIVGAGLQRVIPVGELELAV